MLADQLKENGLRLNDEFEITPMIGRTKRIRLDRTKYEIILEPKSEFMSLNGNILTLPTLSRDRKTFKLELTQYYSRDKDVYSQSRERYQLMAMEDSYFKHNGSISRHCFLERNDQFSFDYNSCSCLSHVPSSNNNGDYDNPEITKQVMTSKLNILLEGETGTGKTTTARKIHEQSGRIGHFVHLNLSTITPSLLSSELFGHVKGSFTGAVADKRGAFMEANKGTLFLDELDSLPLEIQTKLLLFMDDKRIRPVGGSHSKKTDVRLILASGQNLENLVDKKVMRNDFYYRVTSGFRFKLKNLNSSPKLFNRLIDQVQSEHDVIFEQRLIEFYRGIKWQGNIRQFLGHLEKKIVLAKSRKILLDTVDFKLQESFKVIEANVEKVSNLQKVKEEYCRSIYFKFDQNCSTASKYLEITPHTLKKVIRKKVG